MSKIGVACWKPGEVERGMEKGGNKGHDVFRVGEHDGRITPRIEAVAEMLKVVDGSLVTDNLWGERWSKLSANSMGNPVQGMSGLGSFEIASSEIGRAITIHLAAESSRVGLAQGYTIPKINGETAERWADAGRRETWEALDTMLTPKSASGRNWKASMAQDVTKGRPTEIDYMNGHVVAKGREKRHPDAGLRRDRRGHARGGARHAQAGGREHRGRAQAGRRLERQRIGWLTLSAAGPIVLVARARPQLSSTHVEGAMVAGTAMRSLRYALVTDHSPAALVLRETSPAATPPPNLLDRVRHAIRARHYSRRTEKAYVHWIKRYIFFHAKRHPAEMGAVEITAFLTALAVRERVAASTQNQALNALLFLYREVLWLELPWLDDLVRAKRPEHLPTVLTRDEVRRVIDRVDGVPRLIALLLYGAGLRLLECTRMSKGISSPTFNELSRNRCGSHFPPRIYARSSALAERASRASGCSAQASGLMLKSPKTPPALLRSS